MTDEIRLVRPDDLLVAWARFEGCGLSENGGEIVRTDPDAGIVLRLPPQHFSEPLVSPWFDRSLPDSPPVYRYAVPLLASAGARLSWRMPQGVDRVKVDSRAGALLDTITSWAFQPGGMWIDLGRGTASLGEDGVEWTASPQPLGLVSPLWSIAPRSIGEGWRFSHFSPVSPLAQEYLGFLSVDFMATGIVIGDSEPFESVERPYEPPGADTWIDYLPPPLGVKPVLAKRLRLTSLGGHLWITGPHPRSDGDIEVGEYEHRTSLGRDVAVRRAVPGRLSTGHRATLTEFSERLIMSDAHVQDRFVAGMVGRAELLITDPLLDLEGLASQFEHGGREMPFRTLELLGGPFAVRRDVSGSAHWLVDEAGHLLLADLRATGYDGAVVTLRMPVAFTPDTLPAGALTTLLGPGRGVESGMLPTRIDLAPSIASGSTAVTVTAFQVGLQEQNGSVLPTITGAKVLLESLGDLGGPAVAVQGELAQELLEGATSDAFLRLREPIDLRLPTASVGGLGNPGGIVDTLSATRGIVPAELHAGLSVDDVRRMFPAAKLFGKIDLIQYLDLSAFGADSLKLIAGDPAFDGGLHYLFDAKLRPTEDGPVVVERSASLKLEAHLRRAGATVETTAIGTVTGVGFRLAGAVELRFRTVIFRTNAAGATSLEVQGVDVQFLGAFEFLAEIARKLAGLGASGVRVDADSSGVTAGFDLAVPALSLGMVQIANMAVSAYLRIPFTKAPLSFTLDVASRQHPFVATVAMFGGGGFLSLEMTPDGLRRLDAAIEFGGSLELDIGVASGGVSVMAGIYFGFVENEVGSQSLEFSAYLRASGHLSVLGIVTVFVEFELALAFRRRQIGSSTHAVFVGRGRVTVGVKVLFFSKSVTLELEREFIGSAADPSFADCFEPEDWSDLCLAYASPASPRTIPSPFGV